MQPIEVPEIQADELKEVTDNFGQDSLIGEGSYGRVYYGVLKSGQAAAIKKLDASKQPDEEFLAQVYMCENLGSVFYIGHWSYSFTDTMWFSMFSGFNGIKAETW